MVKEDSRWFTAFFVLALVGGCGDGDNGPGESGAETSTSGGSGETGDAQSITVSGAVVVYPAGVAIDGGEVCWVEGTTAAPCTSTDSSGTFALEGVPALSQGALRFVDDQIVSFAYILRTGEEDLSLTNGFGIDAPEVHEAYFAQAGVEAVEGSVAVTAQLSPGATGYALELTPSSGDGPFYYGGTPGELDPMATETGGYGVGLLLNVLATDGPFDLSFTQAGTRCTGASLGEGLQGWSLPEGVESVYLGVRCD